MKRKRNPLKALRCSALFLPSDRRAKMSLEEIFKEFTPGSVGFIKAVQTHCGMDISNSEIARLVSECPDWWSFEDAWENEFWWTDLSAKGQESDGELR